VTIKLTAFAFLAVAATTMTSNAAASPEAARQRVAITVDGHAHTFVLTPLKPGAVKRDSGTSSDCCWSQRFATRDGQTIEINDPLTTFTGKRGTLVVRYRIEWVDAGHGYTIGTATWKVLRGTGVYAQLTGGGRSAHAWPPGGYASGRAEGFLTSR
jgi:hypothetical protein